MTCVKRTVTRCSIFTKIKKEDVGLYSRRDFGKDLTKNFMIQGTPYGNRFAREGMKWLL